MSLQKILFPVSLSNRCQRALQPIAAMAAKLNAELTLLHVLNPLVDGSPQPGASELQFLQPEKFGCTRYRRFVDMHSDPAHRISSYAAENSVDVIMMPEDRRFRLPTFGGSLSRRMIAGSPCPVWTVPDHYYRHSQDMEVKRVLCALSGGDQHVLDYAAKLSRSLRAHLLLVYAVPEIHEGMLAYGFDEHMPLSIATGQQMLESMMGTAGIEARTIVRTGSTKEVVDATAREFGIDLVVTGRHTAHVKGSRLPFFGFGGDLPAAGPYTLLAI